MSYQLQNKREKNFTYITQPVAGKHAQDSFANHLSWVFLHLVLESSFL